MKLLTIKETAALLRTTPCTVHSYLRKGQLESTKIGRHRLFTEQQVQSFIRSCRDKRR